MPLRYFGIRVTDLDKSLRFYTELFGLKEVRRGDMSTYGGGRGRWVLLRDEQTGQQLELNWYPKGSPYAVPYVPGEGLDHIGFEVDNVEEKFEEFLTKGVRPTDIDPWASEGWQAYVEDPDGNWIELTQRTAPVLKKKPG